MCLTLCVAVIYMTVTLKYDQPLTYELSGSYKHISSDQLLNEIKQTTADKGYLFLNPQQIERKLYDTQIFKSVRVQKGDFKVVQVFVEEKDIVMKQLDGENTMVIDGMGQRFRTNIPTNVPILDKVIKENDMRIIADAMSGQSEALRQQISEITYAFVGEARTEMKLITIHGDIIFVKLNELKQKLPHFLEIDAIMNQKNIMKCEYHFEYNNGSVVVNKMK